MDKNRRLQHATLIKHSSLLKFSVAHLNTAYRISSSSNLVGSVKRIEKRLRVAAKKTGLLSNDVSGDAHQDTSSCIKVNGMGKATMKVLQVGNIFIQKGYKVQFRTLSIQLLDEFEITLPKDNKKKDDKKDHSDEIDMEVDDDGHLCGNEKNGGYDDGDNDDNGNDDESDNNDTPENVFQKRFVSGLELKIYIKF
ncbi:ribonuclease P/MRP protein subunit POP7 ASCRUDRAFT_75613 [Ascoidea rubescens DSM 1968]|uniref:Uncharacterized protein n=1 Tax=Ascoidea rubescens DSM 1968 TaxID=1344418 RepID=A0A1D2VJ16_9ASCO|nr:hypothetical protein ASCRUDRAFT_75613 [Ascoidea rubescens DSM 1968]ODV61622.1 hypothetical protein ASCRUDRAFT_75613 [Ascoidea rubescens DSM 1968]